MNVLNYLAATETDTDGGIFGALGIDLQTLIFQLIAFLILVAVLGKWVFPVLIKTVDKRQEGIEASAKAAAEAQAAADEAEKKIAKLLKSARSEADEIVSTAKVEAAAAFEVSEQKSKKHADQIVANAKEQIEKDILLAKKTLHNETIELVAFATEKVVGKAVSADIDNKVIADSLKGVK